MLTSELMDIKVESNNLESPILVSEKTPLKSLSSPANDRRQTPLRSLDNSPIDHNKTQQNKMVCSDSTDDAGKGIRVDHSPSTDIGKENDRVMVRPTRCLASPKVERHGLYSPKVSPKHQNSGSSSPKSNIRIKTEAFSEFYEIEEEIGRGKFAVVRRCRHLASGQRRAAKFLRKRRKGKDCRSEVLQEVRMLDTARAHPRLVDLLEVYETTHEIILVMEFAEGGEMFQRILDEDSFSEAETKRLLRQIVDGVVFLHDKKIVHLDIKPQNVLLTTKTQGNVKLCDLGFARPLNLGADIRDIIGTPDYVAPEILNYEPIHTGSDMWSVGVLTYVMLTGCAPFTGDDKQETFLNISQVNLDFPDELFGDVSEDAIDFIKKLLVHDPRERLSARDCLYHPWLHRGTVSESPIGQRRALTPPSPDTLAEEPLKKCRCQAVTPPPMSQPATLKIFDESVNHRLSFDTVLSEDKNVSDMVSEEDLSSLSSVSSSEDTSENPESSEEVSDGEKSLT